MTKAQIRDRLTHDFWRTSQTETRWLAGHHVATLSNDRRSIRLRHVWSYKDDEHALDSVCRAFMEYAQEIAEDGLAVKLYNKRGDLLGHALPRCGACVMDGCSERLVTMSREDFAASLPAAVTYNGWISVSESIRRDLRLAATVGRIPMDAKFWVRETSCSHVISVEITTWPGAVLAEDYAAAVMEGALAKRDMQWTDTHLEPPQDARLAPEVNGALTLVKTFGDRRIAEIMETQPMNYYGPIQYCLTISSPRLIAAAERGLRIEVDPEYADFMLRVQSAAERLGRQVVRSLCGEGGVDLSSEQRLEELVKLDAEARGRALTYDRQLARWVVTGGWT